MPFYCTMATEHSKYVAVLHGGRRQKYRWKVEQQNQIIGEW